MFFFFLFFFLFFSLFVLFFLFFFLLHIPEHPFCARIIIPSACTVLFARERERKRGREEREEREKWRERDKRREFKKKKGKCNNNLIVPQNGNIVLSSDSS